MGVLPCIDRPGGVRPPTGKPMCQLDHWLALDHQCAMQVHEQRCLHSSIFHFIPEVVGNRSLANFSGFHVLTKCFHTCDCCHTCEISRFMVTVSTFQTNCFIFHGCCFHVSLSEFSQVTQQLNKSSLEFHVSLFCFPLDAVLVFAVSFSRSWTSNMNNIW